MRRQWKGEGLSREEKERFIAAIVERLKERQDVVAVYLFGSCAHGACTLTSDIDIAVLLHPYTERAEDELSTYAGVDLVVLNSVTNPLLIYEVLQRGKPLFIRDKALFFRLAFPLAKRFIHSLPILRAFGVWKDDR